MKAKILVVAMTAALAATQALAISPYGNGTQKGSLLIFPKVNTTTLIQIANDYSDKVSVKCYYQSNEGSHGANANNGAVDSLSVNGGGNYRIKHHTDFQFDITKNQTVWWWTQGQGNGLGVPSLFPMADGFEGIGADLKCWAVNSDGSREIHHNHLIGAATVLDRGKAYTYNAYHFQAMFPNNATENTGNLLKPPYGQLDLDGVEYDSCSRMALGQFNAVTRPFELSMTPTPELAEIPTDPGLGAQVDLVQCSQDLREVYTPPITKYVFEIYSENEIKFTGTEVCGDSWIEIDLWNLPHARRANLKTDRAYFRAQAVGQLCPGAKYDGVMGVLAQRWPNGAITGSTLNGRGSYTGGKICWDPNGGGNPTACADSDGGPPN